MTARATVIAYHALGSCPRSDDPHNLFVGAEAFSEQMAFLARNRDVVALDTIVSGRLDTHKPAVAITFDDAYRNVLRVAGPILAEHGFPSTVFVPTGWIGKINGWIEPTQCDVQIMSESELRAAEKLRIAVESHGHNHIDYSVASPDDIRTDIERSAEHIATIVGRPPVYLAYPYGRESPSAREIVSGSGLKAAFTIDAPHLGPHAFARVQITPFDGIRLFALKTSGFYSQVRNSRAVAGAYKLVRPLARRVMGASRG